MAVQRYHVPLQDNVRVPASAKRRLQSQSSEKTISYWFDLPIDVAEFEEKLGIGAESGDYRIIEKLKG